MKSIAIEYGFFLEKLCKRKRCSAVNGGQTPDGVGATRRLHRYPVLACTLPCPKTEQADFRRLRLNSINGELNIDSFLMHTLELHILDAWVGEIIDGIRQTQG